MKSLLEYRGIAERVGTADIDALWPAKRKLEIRLAADPMLLAAGSATAARLQG